MSWVYPLNSFSLKAGAGSITFSFWIPYFLRPPHPTLTTQEKDLFTIVLSNQKRHLEQRKWIYRCIDWLLQLKFLVVGNSFFFKVRARRMWKQETNMHHHLFQEHFLRIFPNEGAGSVNLRLIRKYSLPKVELGAGEELKEMPTEAKPASMNSIMPWLPPSPPPPPPCVSLHLWAHSKLQNKSSIPSSQEELLSNPTIHPLNCWLSCFPSQPHLLCFILEVIMFILLHLRRVLPSLWTFPLVNIFPRKKVALVPFVGCYQSCQSESLASGLLLSSFKYSLDERCFAKSLVKTWERKANEAVKWLFSVLKVSEKDFKCNLPGDSTNLFVCKYNSSSDPKLCKFSHPP